MGIYPPPISSCKQIYGWRNENKCCNGVYSTKIVIAAIGVKGSSRPDAYRWTCAYHYYHTPHTTTWVVIWNSMRQDTPLTYKYVCARSRIVPYTTSLWLHIELSKTNMNWTFNAWNVHTKRDHDLLVLLYINWLMCCRVCFSTDRFAWVLKLPRYITIKHYVTYHPSLRSV